MTREKMRMLRWMCEHNREDNIKNEDIRDKVEMNPMVDKMRKERPRFRHVNRMCA